jgi:aryl-alcohol dehydrogenase-like predicted oxidoreductase
MYQLSFPHYHIEGPIMGLGLAALGRPGYINLGHGEDLNHTYDEAVMEAHAHQVLEAAYQSGIRYFDAARSYGKAEYFLSTWLEKRRFKKGEIIIGSKWGYTYTANWQVKAEKHEVKEHSLAVLNRQWDLSRRLLPHLQLYQIHSATFESGVLENTAVLKRLAELKGEGVLIGLSTSGPKQSEVLAKAMEVRIDGHALFDSVQATYNLLAKDVAEQLQEAHRSGMIVIIKEALANGRLTNRNTSQEFAERKRRLQQLAQKHKVSLDSIALAFLFQSPFVSIVLSGATSIEQLNSNVKGTEIQLTEPELEELSKLRMPEMDYWNERAALAWN